MNENTLFVICFYLAISHTPSTFNTNIETNMPVNISIGSINANSLNQTCCDKPCTYDFYSDNNNKVII